SEVPQVSREGAVDVLREVARIRSGLAVLQGGPDGAGARAFRRFGLALVVGIADAEVERLEGPHVQRVAEVQVDPVFRIGRRDLLIAPGTEAGDAGHGAVAANTPVQWRAGAMTGPARAATVVRGHFGDELARRFALPFGRSQLQLGSERVV